MFGKEEAAPWRKKKNQSNWLTYVLCFFWMDVGECVCVFFPQTYIRTDPSARSPESVPIITIQQGNEPRSFKQLFPKWKNNFWK